MSEPNAMHVHAVATKYASSQLEISRSLCAHLSLAAGVDARHHKQIGFQLMYASTVLLRSNSRQIEDKLNIKFYLQKTHYSLKN